MQQATNAVGPLYTGRSTYILYIYSSDTSILRLRLTCYPFATVNFLVYTLSRGKSNKD